jgi:FKBP-type peptidyl-prolyl cis-trans isomerase FkpA
MRLVIVLIAVTALLSGCSRAEPEAGAGSSGAAAGGLQIVHVVEGSGPSPGPTSVVKVHYQGTFPDGKVFDSSITRGQPAVFPLNRVIPCWTQALQQMKVGGKAKLTCPPELAYGPSGAPPTIPPNATLLFDVELISIE